MLAAVVTVAASSLIAACATAGGTPAGGTAGAGTTTQPTTQPAPTGGVGVPVSNTAGQWPVSTSAHVDLWLHSFAVLTDDTTRIPLFRRGYRDSIATVKRRSNVLTSLDANRETLARRLNTNPALVQAQFLALSFASFAEMRRTLEVFLQFEGQPNRAPDQTTASVIAGLAPVFPTAADREWLRLFLAGVIDEQSRFYDAEYQRVLRSRSGVVAAVDSVWQKVYHKKFERFLTNTSQRQGEMLLSLPLGGEGRTSLGPTGATIVAVPFPARTADRLEPIFVLAHEITGNLVSTVVSDNTTPAQQRDGSASSFVSFAQVHGGLLLLQRIAPELVEPYARYYLAQGGQPVPTGSATVALQRAFPLPKAITDALLRQIDIVLGGI